jgi:hypothetical protein
VNPTFAENGTALAKGATAQTMQHLTTFLATFLLAALVHGQTVFPPISGETASGTTISIPRSEPRKYTIVGIAFNQKASDLLEDWLEPAYLRFVAQHGLFAGEYDADIYFMPVFVGLNKAAYEPSMKKFRKGAAPELVEHVLFSKDDLQVHREELAMKDKEIPYFFVLDAQGRIVFRTQGKYTDEKLEAIEDVLMK